MSKRNLTSLLERALCGVLAAYNLDKYVWPYFILINPQKIGLNQYKKSIKLHPAVRPPPNIL